MDPILTLTVCFYLLSTAAYFLFLFNQKPILHRIGFGLLVIGFAFHCGALGWAFGSTGQVPVKDLYQTLSVAGWAVAGVFIGLRLHYRLNILGVFAAPLAALIMVAALRLPRHAVPAQSIFHSLWLLIHIVTIFIGEAALALACGVGILYLLQEKAIKTKQPGFFYRRLPSLDMLDSTGYGCIVVGFTLLTVGLITGFVYAKTVWGRFWSWDPKEVWSGITWLIYAALLHQRLTVGWRGRQAAILAIIGFAAILFTFFGVNFLLKGHHGVFTRW